MLLISVILDFRPLLFFKGLLLRLKLFLLFFDLALKLLFFLGELLLHFLLCLFILRQLLHHFCFFGFELLGLLLPLLFKLLELLLHYSIPGFLLFSEFFLLLFNFFKFPVILIEHFHLVSVGLFHGFSPIINFVWVDFGINVQIVVMGTHKKTISMIKRNWFRHNRLTINFDLKLVGIFSIWKDHGLSSVGIKSYHTVAICDAYTADGYVRLEVFCLLSDDVFALTEGFLDHTRHGRIGIDIQNMRSSFQQLNLPFLFFHFRLLFHKL